MSRSGSIALAICCFLAAAGGGFLIGRTTASPAATGAPDAADTSDLVDRITPPNRLATLGYIDSAPVADPSRRGVVIHRRDAATPGLNLHYSRTRSSARLIDNEGDTVWTWSYEVEGGWSHAELLPDGGLLVVAERELLRLTPRSQPVWRTPGGFHHALDVSGDRVYALRHLPISAPEPGLAGERILADRIEVLDLATGAGLESIDLIDVVLGSPYRWLVERPAPPQRESPLTVVDLLHANDVQRIAADHPNAPPALRGSLLVSLRQLSAVVALDERREISWIWGPGILFAQHDPTLLPSGNLLVFDNGVERSRVLELDPSRYQIVWQYSAPDLFTRTRGSVQRLISGHTLITESNDGRVVEVTPDGEIVWEFLNPDMTADGERLVLWRMVRFGREQLQAFPDELLDRGFGPS